MMQAPKNTKCNMVYKDYKHGLYLLELFVLWLKILKCNTGRKKAFSPPPLVAPLTNRD